MTPWFGNTEHPPPKAGEPAMHRAARLGDHAAIRDLASQGADLETEFDIGLDPGARVWPATPLMMAAGSGDGASVETVKLLLELGADPRHTVGSQSAATFACSGLGWNYRPGGDEERLRVLLTAGSPLPTSLSALNRLMCDASFAGDIDRLRVLLEHGLSADGHWDSEEAKERSRGLFEHLALDRQPPEMLDLMNEEFRESIRAMEQEMIERDSSAPSWLEVPLFRAAESGSAECLSFLLAAGANPLFRDSSDRTALYYAGSPAVVHALVAIGLPLEDADTYGWSPLVSSLSDGEEAIPRIQALIEAGANVNASHDHGYTTFMSAVGSARRIEVLRILVAAGANPHAISEYGYNAYHAAIDVNGEANAEESVRETLTFLKELGVDIEQRTTGGQTPLARAIQEGTGIEVSVLCELGANVNTVCPMHVCGPDECARIELPLLFHAADGIGVHRDVKVASLLRAGANPFAKDSYGFRPLERVVASLCSEASNPEPSFHAFFRDLPVVGCPSSTRDQYVKALIPELHAYATRFAEAIPFRDASEFSHQLRQEHTLSVATLLAYEAWAQQTCA